MNTLRSEFISAVSAKYTTEECSVLWRRSLSHICSVEYSQTYFIDEANLNAEQKESLYDIAQRLSGGEPFEYITGFAEFCSLKFRVNNSVLIPRLETQEIVDLIEKNYDSKKSNEILDIGTGSGCIAISLALKLPLSKVTALDISAKALEVAQGNAELHKADNVKFIQADILNCDNFCDRRFNLIVSNPPYVRRSETPTMPERVLDYEPHTALFVDDSDPLIFYKRIAALAPQLLTPDGSVMVEANQWLCRETASVFEKAGFETKIIKDLFSEERFIVAKRHF
ncbi:MAG: peptide chain release factor N(5)-glutamine methyltransferase [Paludibacteraceae bacterium]|nr:peptide chain release factor N(5)-glutamine methyltransferase [Paludibacteraceae bacterium]